MADFKMISIRDFKKESKYIHDSSWKRSVLLPCFREDYTCFCRNKDYSFDELNWLFFHGNDSDQIGAISVIAEQFPYELYEFIKDSNHYIPSKHSKFLLQFVIPDYLPLILPKDKLTIYVFSETYSDDIWVNILAAMRTRM